jgi:probable HAF family extracellular repeat protein
MKSAFVAIALVAWSGCAFAQKYVITELEQLPEVGAGFSGSIGAPLAINDKGRIVGFSYLNGIPISHAMIWNDARPTDLGTLGGSSSVAKGLNDKGQVVGSAETPDGHNHATIWNRTTPKDLGTLGGTDSEASAINEAGVVVGDSSLFNGDLHAVIFDSRMPADHLDLGTIGGPFSLALAINAAGQIAGYSSIDPDGRTRAVIWHASAVAGVISVMQLHTLGGINGIGIAINNSGQVAGLSQTAGGTYHAVVWNGVDPIDLGTLGTLTISEANGLNDRGQVVGTSFAPIGPATAVLWQDGKVVDLNTLISGPLAASRTLNQAMAINNKGVIAGTGTDDLTGTPFMFVLTPVAESFAALLTEVTGVGPGRSLAHKVKLAEAYYSAHDTDATCAVLTGFKHEVKALAGRRIDRMLAKRVIADAKAIEAAIGCRATDCILEKDD